MRGQETDTRSSRRTPPDGEAVMRAGPWLAVTPTADVPVQPERPWPSGGTSAPAGAFPPRPQARWPPVVPGCFTPCYINEWIQSESVKETGSLRRLCKQLRRAVARTGLGLSGNVSPPRLRPTLTRGAPLETRPRKASPDQGDHAVTLARTGSGPVLISVGTVPPAARSLVLYTVCSEGGRKPQV